MPGATPSRPTPTAAARGALLVLFATLCLLALAGCPSFELPPPPHDVYLSGNVPEGDRASWEAAVDAWNEQVGQTVYTLREGPIGKRCGVLVEAHADVPDALADTWTGECVTTIRYEIGGAWCSAAHELGHQLGLPDGDDGLMGPGCVYVLPSAQDGAAVRARWDMGR